MSTWTCCALYLHVVCLLGLSLSITSQNCPQQCQKCDHDSSGQLINASCSGSTRIESLPSTLQVLHLDKISSLFLPLGHLNRFNLQSLSKLRVLTMNNCSIKYIINNPFETLKELEHLDLAYNDLPTLNDSEFIKLTKLKILNLKNNNISSIHTGAFQGLTSLQIVNLQNNHLTELDPSIFSGLVQLNRLDLQHNNIAFINDTKIAITSLTWLNLNQNEITSLPTELLVSISNRNVEVFLAENDITEIRNTKLENVVLRTLSLRANKINLVQADALKNSFIQELDLQQNRLVGLPEEMKIHVNRSMTLLLANNLWCCNCSLRWMASIINSSLTQPTCDKPDYLHGQNIVDISPKDLCATYMVPTTMMAVPPRQDHVWSPALATKMTTDPTYTGAQSTGDNSIGTVAGVVAGVFLLFLLIALAVYLTMPRVKVAPEIRMRCRKPDENFNPHLTTVFTTDQ